MSVNGVTTTQTTAAYSYSPTENVKAADQKTEEKKTESTAADKTGVVYQPSKETTASSTKKTYTPDTNLVNKLKADAEARTQQLRTLVEKMMSGRPPLSASSKRKIRSRNFPP